MAIQQQGLFAAMVAAASSTNPFGPGKIAFSMTSNTAPAPYTVFASVGTSGVYACWVAFNGNIETGTSGYSTWDCPAGSLPAYIGIDVGSGNVACVTIVGVAGNFVGTTYDPQDFKLQGSNDGSSYTDLLTRTNASLAAGENTFTVTSPDNYRYYRLYITAANGGGNTEVCIREISLYNTP